MGEYSIDIDSESVYLDGAWCTRDELTRRIKEMLDKGDYAVARPSAALQELNQELQHVQTLGFRCAPELADGLTALAARLGRSTGFVVREALTQYLTDANSSPPAPEAVDVPIGPEPIQLHTGRTHQELSNVIVEPAVAVVPVAGPGALRAAGIGVDPKKPGPA